MIDARHAFLVAAPGWLAAFVVMAALWALQRRTKNAAIVDAGWASLVGGLAMFYASKAVDGMPGRRLAIASMMGSWGARLAVQLLYDRVIGKPEDGRYAARRARSGARADTYFFFVFEAQAAAAVVFSLPALVASINPNPQFSLVEYAAMALWVIGFSGESTADRQLLAFRMDPENRGKTFRAGLWRYSRHPNYFFEWIVWLAYATFASASPYGWVTFVCPAALLYLLLRVTGIPPTEAQALRSRNDYRDYQQSTSAFVPWVPRSAPDHGTGNA